MKKKILLLSALLPLMTSAQSFFHFGEAAIVDGKLTIPVSFDANMDNVNTFQLEVYTDGIELTTELDAAIFSFDWDSNMLLFDNSKGGVFPVNTAIFNIIVPETEKSVFFEGMYFGDPEGVEVEVPFDEMTINTLEIGKGGFSTYSNIAVDVEITGATVNAAIVNGDKVELEEIVDGLVPVNTGVILQGTEGKLVVVAETQTSNVISVNDLVASDGSHDISGDYVLATVDGVTQFYQFEGSYVMPAGKAYIPGSKASGARLSFSDEETGINTVVANQEDVIYNLQGTKLQTAGKGINIVNGKKVMY